MSRVECGVCEEFYDEDELNENYRGYLTCPTCDTELKKNKRHGGPISRDSNKHKK